jgi:hypothetical protein
MKLRTHVEFRSAKFPAYPGEEEEINPNLWGKRLAEFLRDNLQLQGIQTEEIFAEDWGWIVPVTHPSVFVWIGCEHYQEYPDGYLVFIEPSKPVVTKSLFKKINMVPTITQIADAMDKILSSDPEIFGLSWWDEKEK